MRKEVIYAIVAGIIFGVVIAFGVYRVNSTLKPEGLQTSKGTPTPAPTPIFKITLSNPEELDVIDENPVRVSGITRPMSWVVITGEENDSLTKADEKGTFEGEIKLVAGANQIVLTALDQEGNQSFEKLVIVYSTEFKKISSASETEEEATEEGIREKVQKKVEEALNKPKAYLGVVTDIADSTIQVKTPLGEIKQVSVNKEEVTVIKGGTTGKTVKFEDIAIGDFIVAMGYKRDRNGVLDSQRILITSPLTEPKIKVAMAKGSEVTPDKKTQIFLFKDGKTTKAKASDIEDESQIIYVPQETDGKSLLRTIFIIS